LDEDVLSTLSVFELELLRAEVYAVHGYFFKVDWINDFFLGQPWYVACKPGERGPDDPDPGITMAELRRIQMVLDARSQLGKDLDSCWPVNCTDSLEYSYYSDVLFEDMPLLLLPEGYVEHSPLETIEGGPRPSFQPYHMLPEDLCRTVYERPDSTMAYIDMLEPNAQAEIAATINESLALYGLRMEDTVYRVYFLGSAGEPDSVACIEEVALGSGSWSSMIDPYVVWRMHYSPVDGFPALFQPLGGSGGWETSVAVLAFFTPEEGDSVLQVRASIYGDIQSLELLILDGPFNSLPLEVNIYDQKRDGAGRFGELTGRT
jgi:hypothetical protein